ncbi:hypothetical protein AAG906_037030 [Vitis piasezkii]
MKSLILGTGPSAMSSKTKLEKRPQGSNKQLFRTLTTQVDCDPGVLGSSPTRGSYLLQYSIQHGTYIYVPWNALVFGTAVSTMSSTTPNPSAYQSSKMKN